MFKFRTRLLTKLNKIKTQRFLSSNGLENKMYKTKSNYLATTIESKRNSIKKINETNENNFIVYSDCDL